MSSTPTEVKAAELARFHDALDRAAQAGTAAFDVAFNSPPRGFSVHEISPDKRFTRVSPGHTALVGYQPKDLLGRHASDFVILKETADRAMSRKLAPGALLLPFNRTWRKADGGEASLLMLDRHIKDAQGTVVGIRTAITQAPAISV
jgi:PAS domain S-box-containing protein